MKLNETPSLEIRRVFESLPELYLILSSDLVILFANDAYLQATDTQYDSIVGTSLFEIFPESDAENDISLVRESLQQVLATHAPHQTGRIRYDLQPRQKEAPVIHYWRGHNIPMLDDAGAIQYIIHRVEDITEEVEIETRSQTFEEQEARHQQALEEQRNLLQAWLDQAPVAMSLFQGEDLMINSANQSICDIWGYSLDQVLGRPLLEAVPELIDQGFDLLLREVLETGVPYRGKERPARHQRNGKLETSYYNFVYQPLYDEQSEKLGVLAIATDVTEQVKSRQQVEQNNEKFQHLNEKLSATVEELGATNEELTEATTALEQLNSELEKRVEQRTHDLNSAKKDIQRQRDRLEHFFMQAPAAICILDGPEMIYELINPAYQQLFSTRQMLGKPLLIALPELVDQPVWPILQQVYNTGETYRGREVPVSLAREEGGALMEGYYSFTYQARFNEQDQVDGIMVFAFEVTDQVVARQTVEASAHRLQLVTDALPVLISYVDKNEVYRFANLAYQEWFHHSPDQLLGRSIREVIGEKAYQAAEAYIARVLAGERLAFEAEMPYRDNFTKHIHTSYVPNIQNGQVEGFYALITDITEHVQDRQKMEDREKEARALAHQLTDTNQALLSSNSQLTRTNADLDNFIYTASHDLKAPISNIESLIATLVRVLPNELIVDEQIQRILSMMDTSIERFKRTIAHLTEIVKLQKEHNEEAVSVDIIEVIQEVWLDLDFIVGPSEAKLTVDIVESPPIHFSEKNMRSVVYNLLSNAIKYQSPERTPQIRISCEHTPEYYVIIVDDNGLGIENERVPQLFSMFKRFHDHVEGTGIGLYMVKKIVESAGGKVEVESQVNQGTTFRIFFSKAVQK